MMIDRDYLNEVAEELFTIYPEADIKVKEVVKPDGVKLAIQIKFVDERVTPVIYGESLRGLDALEDAKLASKIYEQYRVTDECDYDWVLDWEKAKDKIQPRLVNEKAVEWLADKPNRVVLGDLRLVFELRIGLGVICITNDYMKQWDVRFDELEREARKNCKPSIKGAVNTMADYMGILGYEDEAPEEIPEDDELMYVITNVLDGHPFCHGAGVLPFVLDKIKERFDSFYLIPSSVSEFLLVPNPTEDMTEEAVTKMILEVNNSEVPASDVLGDHVYSYKNGKWVI